MKVGYLGKGGNNMSDYGKNRDYNEGSKDCSNKADKNCTSSYGSDSRDARNKANGTAKNKTQNKADYHSYDELDD